MCLHSEDLAYHDKIMEKMRKHERLSSEDKQFMVEHGLQQKFDSYAMLLDIKDKYFLKE